MATSRHGLGRNDKTTAFRSPQNKGGDGGDTGNEGGTKSGVFARPRLTETSAEAQDDSNTQGDKGVKSGVGATFKDSPTVTDHEDRRR